MVDLTLPGSAPLAFSAAAVDPLGSFQFIFDSIGFGPTNGSVRIDDDLIGLGIPGIDVGIWVDYALGARLVVEAGFDGGTTAIGYTVNEGSFTKQTALFEFNDQIEADLAASGRALYRNSPIVFSMQQIAALGAGTLVATGGDPAQTFIEARLDYTLGLVVRDPFIETFFTTFSPGASATLIPTTTSSIEILHRTQAGEPIFSEENGPYAGSFISVPTLPDYTPAPPVQQLPGSDPSLPLLRIEDTGAPFAQLSFNIAQAITESLAIPLAVVFEAGDFRADLEVLRALATTTLSVGQDQTFSSEAVHVRLELFDEAGVSTGQVVQGTIGQDLAFDSLGVGKGHVRADYTLFGTLETRTGVVAGVAFDLGLLAGRLRWDGFGPDFDVGFGPLIPLPSPSVTTGLLPLTTDREAVTFAPITRFYPIYSERDAIGTNASDLLNVGPSQTLPVQGFGGADTINGYDINGDRLDGGTGNDLLRGSGRKFVFDTPPAMITVLSDSLRGGTGDDTLYGGDAADLLVSGGGMDAIFGGLGDDTLISTGTDGTDI